MWSCSARHREAWGVDRNIRIKHASAGCGRQHTPANRLFECRISFEVTNDILQRYAARVLIVVNRDCVPSTCSNGANSARVAGFKRLLAGQEGDEADEVGCIPGSIIDVTAGR